MRHNPRRTQPHTLRTNSQGLRRLRTPIRVAPATFASQYGVRVGDPIGRSWPFEVPMRESPCEPHADSDIVQRLHSFRLPCPLGYAANPRLEATDMSTRSGQTIKAWPLQAPKHVATNSISHQTHRQCKWAGTSNDGVVSETLL